MNVCILLAHLDWNWVAMGEKWWFNDDVIEHVSGVLCYAYMSEKVLSPVVDGLIHRHDNLDHVK